MCKNVYELGTRTKMYYYRRLILEEQYRSRRLRRRRIVVFRERGEQFLYEPRIKNNFCECFEKQKLRILRTTNVIL